MQHVWYCNGKVRLQFFPTNGSTAPAFLPAAFLRWCSHELVVFLGEPCACRAVKFFSKFSGYHEGYTEHLPFWVSWTENLAVASMGIWWAAGFSTAAIRIIDDDARGLPMDGGDVQVNKFIRILRSERLHDGLALAHTLSCIGLFISIILLCIAMGLMKGSVTACELCLCFVALGFAAPHALVALRRLDFSPPKKTEDAPLASAAPEAAAQEAQLKTSIHAGHNSKAASLGPQLCVILALADSPGHAYLWQNFVYFVAAIAYVAAVAACGRSPPKASFYSQEIRAGLVTWVSELLSCRSRAVSHRPAVVSDAEAVLFAFLAASGAVDKVQGALPSALKSSITVAIGVFQAFVGLQLMGLVVKSDTTLVAPWPQALSNAGLPHILIGHNIYTQFISTALMQQKYNMTICYTNSSIYRDCGNWQLLLLSFIFICSFTHISTGNNLL
eukprot:Skav211607  [mRNA]  locus=scaffold2962:197501:204726:- [translate_table: standard]